MTLIPSQGELGICLSVKHKQIGCWSVGLSPSCNHGSIGGGRGKVLVLLHVIVSALYNTGIWELEWALSLVACFSERHEGEVGGLPRW